MNGKIVVLGAGESGLGAALLAKAKGLEVFVSDQGKIHRKVKSQLKSKGIPFEEEGHSADEVLSASEIIKSPGIPETAPLVVEAKKNGIAVISEIEFAARYTKAKFIAITGSNGKTTTTLLTYHFLQKAGYNVGLAGNIGDSLAKQVIEDDWDYFVLELSSFQLDGMFQFRAHIAILLNITPDHLDRYESFEHYTASKFRITQNQTRDDYFISFMDDPVITEYMDDKQCRAFQLGVSLENRILNGGFMVNNNLMISINNHFSKVMKIDAQTLPLTGKHNMINCLCAMMAALAAGVSEEAIVKSFYSFNNAPHRLEEVGVMKGVRYINDSKATNIDAVKYALDSFEKPVIWVAGGVDKGNDYTQIEELVYEKVKAIICIGKDNVKIAKAFADKVPMILEAESMKEVVKITNEISNAGDLVLLSPACASFDRFKNYEDRGDKFKDEVKSMEKGLRMMSIFTF